MIREGDTVEIGHISQEFIIGEITSLPNDDVWLINNAQYEYIVYPTGLLIMKEKDESQT